jgi:hypothetical protein
MMQRLHMNSFGEPCSITDHGRIIHSDAMLSEDMIGSAVTMVGRSTPGGKGSGL